MKVVMSIAAGAWLRSLCQILAAAIAFLPAAETSVAAVATWTGWEHTLTSTTRYANPYRQVSLTVTYSAPTGQTFQCCGFWDGSQTFKIRFMFPTAGVWQWKTSCSDATNDGLNNKIGTVEVVEYGGDNPLYKKGYLKVSDDKRYLQYANGDPFLWIGDTPWAAFIAATQDEWQRYVQNRKDNKFNILQVHCGGAWAWIDKRKVNRDGDAPFKGSGQSFEWNPAYWQQVDRKVRAANDLGLIVYICAVRQPGPGFPEDDTQQVALFARNLAARMMGSFVVFSPIADDIWTPQADAAGHAIDQATPIHLISAHPRFFLEPAVTFHGKDYVDVVGVQPGCGWTFDPYKKEKNTGFSQPLAAQNAVEWPLVLYRVSPVKPVVNQEGQYDAPGTDKMVKLCRASGYWSLLSGAKGYTYGSIGVWNWGVNPRAKKDGDKKQRDLTPILKRASATQMKYMYEFVNAVPWWTLEPAHDLVKNQADEWLKKMVAAKSASGDLGVAYLPDNAEITIDMTAFPAEMQAKWYNPATGEYEVVSGSVPVAAPHTFARPPGWEDALLLLTRFDSPPPK